MAVALIVIILFATLIGSICGMGGGVIIKPLLDAITNLSTFQISLISGSCVLAMSIASLIKHYISKTPVDVKLAIFLSIGSIGGGFLGDFIFGLVEDMAIKSYGDNAQSLIKIIQNSVLLLLMILVLVYMLFIKKKGIHANVKNPIITTLVGLLLGTLSVFLDIGGGPINVCVFVLVFGMNLKLASVSSIITIFFAQITKFIKWSISGSFVKNPIFTADLPIYTFILLVVFAVVGGLVGAIINKKFSEKFVNVVYCSAIGFVSLLAIYNIIYNAILIA